MANLVHSAMTGVLGEPPFLNGFEPGAVAPIPVPEPDYGQASANGSKLPSYGVEVIAQLVDRVERRGCWCQTFATRAGGSRGDRHRVRPDFSSLLLMGQRGRF